MGCGLSTGAAEPQQQKPCEQHVANLPGASAAQVSNERIEQQQRKSNDINTARKDVLFEVTSEAAAKAKAWLVQGLDKKLVEDKVRHEILILH
jgi:hypothetical protein